MPDEEKQLDDLDEGVHELMDEYDLSEGEAKKWRIWRPKDTMKKTR